VAALTWQQVAAPNFGDSNESSKLASLLLSNALGGLQGAVGEFQKAQNDAQARQGDAYGSELLSRLGTYGDQASLARDLKSGAFFNGVDRSLVSKDILAKIDDRSRFFLDNNQIAANTRGTELNNQNQGLVNTQLDWANQRTRGFEAARPAAVARMNEIRGLFAQGTPEANAKGQALMQDSSKIFADAGYTPEQVGGVINGSIDTANAGLAQQGNFTRAGDAEVARQKKLEADKLLATVLQGGAGNPPATNAEEAARMIRSTPGIDPDVAVSALTSLKEKGGAVLGDAANPAQIVLDQRIAEGLGGNSNAAQTSPLITYANQHSTRNLPLSPDLTNTMAPILGQMGVTMKVFSGGQVTAEEAAKGLGSRTGSERHDHGGAGDVEFYAADGHKLSPKNAQDLPVLQEIVRRGWANGVTGWGEGDDYMGSGRIHLGFGSKAVWGAGGLSANAPQWLKDAVNGQKAGTAPAGAASPAGAPFVPGTPRDYAAAANDSFARALGTAPASVADENQGYLNNTIDLSNQAQTLIDTIKLDSSFDQTTPLLNDLMNRPDPKTDKSDIVKKLHDDIGGDTGALQGLTLDQLNTDVDAVANRYKIAPDIAASFIKNALAQNVFGTRWLFGPRSVDYTGLDKLVNQFFDSSGKPTERLNGALGLVGHQRVMQANAARLQDLAGQVKSAEQEYFNAIARQKTNPKVKIEAAKTRYQVLQAQFRSEISRINRDKGTRVFSGSIIDRPKPVDDGFGLRFDQIGGN
jgi:hypothetical protein